MRALVVALCLASSGVAHAEGAFEEYRVKQAGDSLELIAAEYYGDRADAIFILVANHMQHARPLKPGEKLRIPKNREYVTLPGDTLASIAKATLGDERRGPFLADFNNMSATDSLAAGTVLSIPLTVTHVSAGGESTAQIAAAYFGDSKNADLLKKYNFLDHDVLDKGEQLLVPITHVKIRAQKVGAMDAESVQRREKQRLAREAANAALPSAHDAWAQTDFRRVIALLDADAIDLDYLDTQVAIDVAILLGKAYVGVALDAQAEQVFKRALRRNHDYVMSSFDCSPKVREVWKKAGGHVEHE